MRPRTLHVGERRDRVEEALEPVRGHAALGRLAGHVHLDQRVHACVPRRAARRSSSSASSRRSRDWMTSKSSSGVPHLVGLQVADQVPRDRTAQLGDLVLGLLHPVLAERGHAGLDRLRGSARRPPSSRRRRAARPSGAAARALGRPRDPLTHALEIGRECRSWPGDSSRRSGSGGAPRGPPGPRARARRR